MKKYFTLVICLCLTILAAMPATGETKAFSTSGEHYTNRIEYASEATKADSERRFYVTIEGEAWFGSGDKVYFGPRRRNANGSYSGALCDGLSYYSGKNKRQRMNYWSSANIPSGATYACNIKQATDGPGTLFMLDVKWTP